MKPAEIKSVRDVIHWLSHHVEWNDEASRDMANAAVIALRNTDRIAAAYAIDRKEQYVEGSGCHGALEELAEQFRKGEHTDAFEHGELDDILAHRGMLIVYSTIAEIAEERRRAQDDTPTLTDNRPLAQRMTGADRNG